MVVAFSHLAAIILPCQYERHDASSIRVTFVFAYVLQWNFTVLGVSANRVTLN